MTTLSFTAGALIAVMCAYIALSVPSGVTPPHVPPGSPTLLFPPWFIFRPAVAINEFFAAAAWATTPPPVQILNMATAYWRSEVLYALTKNGVIDAIGKETMTCDSVATKLKLDPFFVCEYMHAGEKLGLFSEKNGLYDLTEAGAIVQSDAPGSLRDMVLMINEETLQAWRASGTKSMHSGESGFKEAFGEEFWTYHNAHPDQEAQFDRAMKSLGFGATGAILSDWKPPKEKITFCDVGGGIGTTAAIFLEHYPNMHGIVFDQESVSERGKAFMSERGFADRSKIVGGDFFKPFPSELSDCDIFFLKYILHDWGDKESTDILRNIKSVAKAGAKIVLTEQVLNTAGVSMETTKSLMSINMLASNKAGAKERTLEEYAQLFTAAGIEGKPKLIPLRDIMSVVEVDVH
jgi:hypothetical protein